MEKQQLKDLTLEEMQKWVESLGEKKFRAQQIFRRIYEGAISFEEMTELPKELRSRLDGAPRSVPYARSDGRYPKKTAPGNISFR